MVLRGGEEVTVGTVAVRLDRRPVVDCPAGHAVAPPEAVDAAMTATETSLPRSRRRLLRGEVCSACSARLTMPARRTNRAVTVPASGPLPVVTLLFDLPSIRCTECGVDQLPSRSQEDLVVSVPAVYAAGT